MEYVKAAKEFVSKQLQFTEKNRNYAIGGILLGVVGTLLVSSLIMRRGRPITSDAWQLTVTLRFKTLADKEAFLAIFEPVAKYVEEKEPTTLSYIISESDKDPRQLFILERYTCKDSYLKVHKTSKQFLHFREQLLIMQNKGRVAIDGQSYIENNVGYIN